MTSKADFAWTKEMKNDNTLISPCLRIEINKKQVIHVTDQQLTSLSRLIINKPISECVYMACDSLLKTILLQILRDLLQLDKINKFVKSCNELANFIKLQ